MLVAVCDQPFGTSTSAWRKIVTPFSLPISAERFSHSTASNGETFPSVKNRSNTSPVRTPAAVPAAAFASSVFPFSACFTVAILSSTYRAPRLGGTLLFYSSARRGEPLHPNAYLLRQIPQNLVYVEAAR